MSLFCEVAAMKIADAIRIVTTCAKEYDAELAGRNILFLYGSEAQYIECSFSAKNFLHLTGIEYNGSPADFYRHCLAGKLSPASVRMAANGTTQLKLEVLPQLVHIHRKAKMVGLYGGTRVRLNTETLAGSITACMGFIRDGNYHVPNTALKEDIRNLTSSTHKVLLVLRKEIRAPLYNEICYMAKGINIDAPNIKAILECKAVLDR